MNSIQRSALVILLCFLFINNLHTQSLLIPYRVANKWGLSDTLGKMVLPAQYDGVQFSLYKNDYSLFKSKKYNLPWNVFYVQKDQLIGIAGAQEIIKPKYAKITCIEQAYYLALSNNDYVQIFTLKGKNILPKGYTYNRQIWSSPGAEYTGYDSHFIFDVDDSLGMRCVYYYNRVNPALSGILISKCSDIDAKSSSASNDGMILQLSKRDAYGYTYALVDYDVQLKRLRIVKKGPSLDDVREPQSNGYGFGGDDGIGYGDVPADRGDRMIDKAAAKNGSFMWKDGKLSIESFDQGYYKGRYMTLRTSVPVQLPDGISNVHVAYYKHSHSEPSYRVQTDSGLFAIYNYVKFMQNRKQFLMLGVKPLAQGYDSIEQIFNPTMPEGERYQFIVGNRNANNQLAFGLIDLNGKILIPLSYQKINWMNDQKPEGRRLYLDDYWVVKKAGKFGIIHSNNSNVFPIVYDSIYLKCGYLEASTFYVLKKDSLYSALVAINQQPYLYNDHRYKTVPLVLKYPPTDVLYLPRKGNESSEFKLIEIRNDKGDVVGYSSVNGFLYFKD